MPNNIQFSNYFTIDEASELSVLAASTISALAMKTGKKEPDVPKKAKAKSLTFNRYFAGYHKRLTSPPEGRFGLEIETEARSHNSYPAGFLIQAIDMNTGGSYWELPLPSWKAVKDGSLRNFGVEFVFKKPLDLSGVRKALEEFKKGTKDVKFLEGEVGTSTHVHCNVQNESLLFLGNFLSLLILFENLLVEYSGETRRSNLFALPTKSAEGNLVTIIKMFRGLEKGRLNEINISEENSKYAAINICNLSSLGSVEIRSFRGTTDADAILNWVSLLDRIYEVARMPGLTPKGIIDEMRRRPFEFYSEVFGNLRDLLRTKDFERLLLPNVSGNLFYVAMIAKAVDWERIDENVWAEVERRESGKKNIAQKLIDYAKRYGGAPEDYALNVNGQVVMAYDAGALTQTDEKATPEVFPYPREGTEVQMPEIPEEFHDEYEAQLPLNEDDDDA